MGIDVLLATFAYSPLIPEASQVAYPGYQQALAENNEVIRGVALSTEAQLFDVAQHMPTDRHYYTDGYHFTEIGNEIRARLFGDFLLQHGTFED